MQAPGVWSPPPCRTHATTHTRSHAHTDGSPFGDRSGRGVQKRTAKQDLARTGSSQGVFIPSTLHDARTAQGFVASSRPSQRPSTGGFKQRAPRVRAVSSGRSHPTTTPLSLPRTYCQHLPRHCQPPYLPPAHRSPGAPAIPNTVPPGRLVYRTDGSPGATCGLASAATPTR